MGELVFFRLGYFDHTVTSLVDVHKLDGVLNFIGAFLRLEATHSGLSFNLYL